MELRCLIVDPNPATRNLLISAVKDLLKIDAKCANSVEAVAEAMEFQYPNLILLRFEHPDLSGEEVLKMIQGMHLRISIVALLAQPNPQIVKKIVGQRYVVDLLTDDADSTRIQGALLKAVQQLSKKSISSRISYYRGFFGFVAVVPSLRERKILTQAGLGIIHNRSLRLAIEYWRGNPNSQLVGVCFNINESFDSRPEECLKEIEDAKLRPWEYGMSEAQNHYFEYWQDPIRDDLMPAAMVTLLQRGVNNLVPVPLEVQKQVLIKVRELTHRGTLEETLRLMGLRLRTEDLPSKGRQFDELIRKLERRMVEVDRRYPKLTRPPTETGYEGFKPDVATPSYKDDSGRMVFTRKKK